MSIRTTPTEAAETTARALLDDEGMIERRGGEDRRLFDVGRHKNCDPRDCDPWCLDEDRPQAERLPFWKRVRARTLRMLGVEL